MGKSIKKLGKDLAKELSNFDGDYLNYDGESDFVDFKGASSLASPNMEKGFSVQIENVSATPQKIALFGGILASATENLVQEGDNVINIEGADPNIKVRALSGNFNKFQEFLRQNPTYLAAAQISATKTEQIDGTMSYSYEDPFLQAVKSKVIRLSDFRTQDTFNDKIVLVELDIVTAKELILEMDIVANGIVTITFHIGATIAPSKGLRKKVNREFQTLHARKSMRRLQR